MTDEPVTSEDVVELTLPQVRGLLIGQIEYAMGRDLVALSKELRKVTASMPLDVARITSDLNLLRDKLSRAMQGDPIALPGRELASASAELRDVLSTLDKLPAEGERSAVVDLTERVGAKWRLAPRSLDSGAAPAAGLGDGVVASGP